MSKKEAQELPEIYFDELNHLVDLTYKKFLKIVDDIRLEEDVRFNSGVMLSAEYEEKLRLRDPKNESDYKKLQWFYDDIVDDNMEYNRYKDSLYGL